MSHRFLWTPTLCLVAYTLFRAAGIAAPIDSPQPSAAEPAGLTVAAPAVFRGVEIRVTNREVQGPERLGEALRQVNALGWLPKRPHVVAAGERVCQILIGATQWPPPRENWLKRIGNHLIAPERPAPCPNSLMALAAALNPGVDLERIQIDQRLWVPAITVETKQDEVSVRCGDTAAAALGKLGIPWVAVPRPRDDCTYLENIELIRYAVRIPVDEENARALSRDPVLVGLADVNARLVGYASQEPAKSYALDCDTRGSPTDGETAPSIALHPRDFENYVNTHHGCCPDGQEGDLRRLLDFPGERDWYMPTCRQGDCPRVIILDHNASTAHPDFSNTWTADDDCSFARDHQQLGHANGLLGIIHAQANRRGLTGVFPAAPARVEPIQETADTPTSDTIIETAHEPQRRIYVVATSWSDDAGSPSGLTQAVAATQRSLWVVAAGQAGAKGIELTDTALTWRPMSLGRAPHVLVVTACDSCTTGDATLLANANRSATLVHVAAPGRDVPTTYLNSGYTLMSGTSPAAAFVGGLAAAIWSNDTHGALSSPDAVKARLQLTSRPVVFEGQSGRLATGIVDPAVALLDASRIWLRRRGEEGYQPVEIVGWCDDSLAVGRTDTGNLVSTDAILPAQFVRRIVRANEGSAAAGWFFFRAEQRIDGEPDPAEWRLKLFGPGALTPVRGPDDEKGVNQPLLQLKDGVILSLAEIVDVIGNPVISIGTRRCPR